MIPVLDFPCLFHDSSIDRDGPPCKKIPHLCPCLISCTRPLLRNIDVKLLQDLIADSAPAAPPQLCTPVLSCVLLLHVGLIHRINKDIRVNEDGRGHEPVHVTNRAHPTL